MSNYTIGKILDFKKTIQHINFFKNEKTVKEDTL